MFLRNILLDLMQVSMFLNEYLVNKRLTLKLKVIGGFLLFVKNLLTKQIHSKRVLKVDTSFSDDLRS